MSVRKTRNFVKILHMRSRAFYGRVWRERQREFHKTIDLITEYNNITCEHSQLANVWKINPGSPQVCV